MFDEVTNAQNWNGFLDETEENLFRPACYLSGFCRDVMETTFSNRRPV
jgi:hypothetical protein